MRTLLPRRRLSWRLIRGTTWSSTRHGFASWTALAALTGVCSERATPNWSPRGSEDREGASDSVPVLRQGRGGRWLGCGCSQPPVLTVPGFLSVMEASGRISFSSWPFAARFAHGNLDIAFTLVSFSPSVYGCCLEYVVFGTRAWFNSGYMFTRGFWRTSHIFYVCALSSWLSSLFRRMEKCAQLMLRVAVSLRALRTLNLDIISTSSSCDGVGVTHFASFFALLRLCRS